MRRVLITSHAFQEAIDQFLPNFREQGFEVLAPPVKQQLSETELLEIIPGIHGVIAGDDFFTSKVLRAANELKIIVKWGVGIDAIDTLTAAELGIEVKNTPGLFADEVADVVIGYAVMLARQLHAIHEEVRRGTWRKIQGISLLGKTLGIVGFGAIGRAVARRAIAMRMRVLASDIADSIGPLDTPDDIRFVDLENLLRESDFLSLNCTLTPDNYHIIDEARLALMKPGAFLINTARGALIAEDALIEALAERRIAGAALDVFESEPLSISSPLRSLDSCILGSHNSSNTKEAVERVNALAFQYLVSALSGSEE